MLLLLLTADAGSATTSPTTGVRGDADDRQNRGYGGYWWGYAVLPVRRLRLLPRRLMLPLRRSRMPPRRLRKPAGLETTR